MIISILISIITSIIVAIIKYLLNLPSSLKNATEARSMAENFSSQLAAIQEDIKAGKADAAHLKALADLLHKIKAYRSSLDL